MRFNTLIVADEIDGDEQAMVEGSELLLADLVAEDYWLDRTPFEQALIDLEVFETCGNRRHLSIHDKLHQRVIS